MMQIVILPKANKQPTMKSVVKWISVKDIMVRESLHAAQLFLKALPFANNDVYFKLSRTGHNTNECSCCVQFEKNILTAP